MKEGEDLVPAADTEFAKDRAFGYSCSDLKHYVEEKTGGRVKASDVASISLEDIRKGGPEQIAAKLLALPKVLRSQAVLEAFDESPQGKSGIDTCS